jgi:hypothetical protein
MTILLECDAIVSLIDATAKMPIKKFFEKLAA